MTGGGAGHGLENMMDEVLGSRASRQPIGDAPQQTPNGGLGGLLEQLGGSQTSTRRGAAPGGLGDLIGSLTGGGGGAGGGLGGLLGGLVSGSGSASGGGLGGLLGGLMAGGAAGAGAGSLGSLLNQALAGKEPDQPPTPHQEVAAALMISAMVQAAKCDGKLDDAEKQKLMGNLGDADAGEIKFVNDLLAAPVDVPGLVAQVPKGMEEQVYLMSLMAIDLDTPNEASYLDQLAKALGIDKARVNDIHAKAGAPALYS